MKSLLTALAWLVAATAAAQTTFVLNDVSDGVYVLRVVNGQATLTAAVDVGGVAPVPPLPPGPNPPAPGPVLSARAQAIKVAATATAADSKRVETAANLEAATTQLKEWTGDTLKGYAHISRAAQFMWDQVTKRSDDQQAWAPTRKLVFDELAKMGQEGADDAAYAAYFDEVAKGLKASVGPGEAQAANGEFLKWLFEFFIKYILPLILKGGIGLAETGGVVQ